jgi:K+-transporting ATPase A subunit
MMGTNGSGFCGFYGMNWVHPFENPKVVTNFFTTFCTIQFPMA